jgi:hypothetical protein
MSEPILPDVAIILEQLRSEVRARRLAAGHSEPSAVEQDLRRSLDEIELHRVVSAHWPLKGRTLPERLLVLVNKLVRRFLRWYINPIVEQQNAYNDTVARSLRLLADAYTELSEQVRIAQNPPEPAERDLSKPPADGTTAALQQMIEVQAQSEPPAHFIELDLAAQQPQLALQQQITAHWPLTGRTLPEKSAALLHKLTRQYLRWLINPIVDQQNAANGAFSATLRDLARLDAEKRAEVAALRAKSVAQPTRAN